MKGEISKTELEIMELLWEKGVSLSFSDIMEYFHTEKGRDWKKQTLSTFLRKLISLGLLTREYRGRKAYYAAAVTREQYELKNVQTVFHDKFHGRITDFLVAVVGDAEITEDDKEKLIEFIEGK